MKWLGRTLLYYLVSNVAVVAVFLFTAVPFQLLSRLTPRAGLTVQGVSGSLFQGLNIADLSYESVDGSRRLVLKGTTIRYSHILELLFSQKLVIDSFTTEGTEITMAEAVSSSPAVNPLPVPSAREEKMKEVIKRMTAVSSSLIRDFHIQELQLSNFKLNYQKAPQLPGFVGYIGAAMNSKNIQSIELEKILLHDFVFSEEVQLGEIKVIAATYDLVARGLVFSKANPRIEELSGKLKRAFDREYMKEDIDFHLAVVGTPKSFKDLVLSVTAVGGKIKGRLGPNSSLNLAVQDLTVSDVYVLPLPMAHMNLEIRAPEAVGVTPMIEATGSFQMGKTTFVLAPLEPNDRMNGIFARAKATVGGHVYAVELSPFGPEGIKVPLRLRSSYTESAQDNLAFLTFSTRYAQLDEMGRLNIDTQLKYFDRTVPASPWRSIASASTRASSRPPKPSKVQVRRVKRK